LESILVRTFAAWRGSTKQGTSSSVPSSLVEAAARAIANAIDDLALSESIASASCGADILFHEACRARKIPTTIVLPFPPNAFERRSVGGIQQGDWVERFRALIANTPRDRLVALDLDPEQNPYGACNRAILQLAQAATPAPSLLALWDGRPGDAPGGTADMINRVREIGGRVVIIDLAGLLFAAGTCV
jgi:hypothetical protein